jgi:hypothetical protein
LFDFWRDWVSQQNFKDFFSSMSGETWWTLAKYYTQPTRVESFFVRHLLNLLLFFFFFSFLSSTFYSFLTFFFLVILLLCSSFLTFSSFFLFYYFFSLPSSHYNLFVFFLSFASSFSLCSAFLFLFKTLSLQKQISWGRIDNPNPDSSVKQQLRKGFEKSLTM